MHRTSWALVVVLVGCSESDASNLDGGSAIDSRVRQSADSSVARDAAVVDGPPTDANVRVEPPVPPGSPSILFTDIQYGPIIGGPGGHGAPISIFGKGFGSARGTSTVTIGGVEVAAYLQWGQNNAAWSALDMITVQPSALTVGGEVVVTVNGLRSSGRATFTTNTGTIYYASPSGSDSAACGEATPCRTIGHVVSDVMSPGDILLVRGGANDENEIWIRDVMSDSGRADAPKVVKAYPGETVRLTNASRPVIISASYITFSSMTFENGKPIGLGSEEDEGDRVYNCRFTGRVDYDAIGVHGNSQVIAGNVCDIDGATTGTQGHCYYISHGDANTVAYNFARGAGGYGIHVFEEQRGSASKDIRRVISNLVVEGNLSIANPLRSGMIVSIEDQASKGNNVDGVVIRNNLFVSNNHAGLVIGGGAQIRNIKVLNNTFYRNGRAGISVWGARVSNIAIENNLFDQTTNTACTSNCSWFTDEHAGLSSDSSGTAPIPTNVTARTNFYLPSPPRLSRLTDSSPITGTVEFVDAAMFDFRIRAGSSVIDRATSSSDVTRDWWGTPRSAGTPDIGAFEFVSP